VLLSFLGNYPKILAIVLPISAGESTTLIPFSLIIAILACAVSSSPPTIAPACPIVLPLGAVCPAIKPTTGLVETGKDKDFKGRPGYDAVYANNYISVPIYFKGYFSEAESEFFGLIGPRFNFLINEKVKNEHLSIYNPDKDPEAKANRFNFAMGAGLGYSYKRQLEFNVRYDFGFSNTYPKLKDYASGDPNAKKNKSEQVLSVGISYIFE